MNLAYDILVELDDVHVGTVAKKSVDLKGLSNDFIVEHKLEFTYQLVSQIMCRKKPNQLKVVVSYAPTVPNSKSVDYFNVYDYEYIAKVICVKANCIGPLLSISTKYLDFYRFSDVVLLEEKIEIYNNSQVATKFNIEVDNNSSVFTFHPSYGELAPRRHLFIKVRFKAKKRGLFYHQVRFLVNHQDPLCLEVYGVVAPTINYLSVIDLKGKYTPVKCEFHGNINKQIVNIFVKDQSIGTLTNFLDFGCSHGKDYVRTLFACLSNTSDKCLFADWDLENEPDDEFETSRELRSVFPDDRIDIDVTFKPKADSKFYARTLYGRMFFYEGCDELEAIQGGEIVNFPVPLEVICSGNSFSTKYSWIPHLQIKPKVVNLPMTVVGFAVDNTFRLERNGQLPVLFKFIPPLNPCCWLQPIAGLIEIDYQIVQVRCEPSTTGLIEETWQVELNGNQNNLSKVKFQVICEEPNVSINDGQDLDFGPIYPNAKKKKVVKLKNLTGLNYSFKFLRNSWLSVEPSIGTLSNSEVVELVFIMTALEDLPSEFVVKCQLTLVMNDKVLAGTPYKFPITVRGTIGYSTLCSFPNKHDFGMIECDERTCYQFYIFNFGTSEIHFSLWYKESTFWIDQSEMNEIDCEPRVATIQPNEKLEITLTITPLIRGFFRNYVMYDITLSADSHEVVCNNDLVWPDGFKIFEFTYTSFYPVFQITDIVRNSCGSLFGNVHIWRMLKIKKLNKTLRDIKKNEETTHCLRIPHAEYNLNVKKDIILMIENTSPKNSTCVLKKKKICDCEIKTTSTSISRREKFFDCPHRDLLHFTISNEEIIANSNELLTIQINYDMEGLQTVCYEMFLSKNRKITLLFKMMGLQANCSVLSTYSSRLRFQLKDVYIGTKQPGMMQAFWIYNNTKTSTNYVIDVARLNELTERYGTEVLTCLNAVGTVMPKSTKAIYFTFCPLDLKKINVHLDVMYQNTLYIFNVMARGVPYYDLSHKDPPISSGNKLYPRIGKKVSISCEYFSIAPMMAFSVAKRLFIMKNLEKCRSIGFHFPQQEFEGVIAYKIIPSQGLMKPQEVIPCLLEVMTFENATITEFKVTCFLIDFTQLQEHIKSKEQFYQKGIELQHEFSISDKNNNKLNSNISMRKTTHLICEAPKIFYRSMECYVDAISYLEKDTKIPLEEQLMLTSYRELTKYRACQFLRLLPNDTYDDLPISSTLVDMAKGSSKSPKSKQCWENFMYRFKTRRKCNDCDDRKNLPSIDKDCYIAIHNIMESLIYDTLKSKMFQHLIHEVNSSSNLYYVHFMNEQDDSRLERIHQLLNMPPQWILKEILQKLLLDCLLSMFKICQYGDKTNPLRPASLKQFQDMRSVSSTQTLLRDQYTDKFMFLLDYM